LSFLTTSSESIEVSGRLTSVPVSPDYRGLRRDLRRGRGRGGVMGLQEGFVSSPAALAVAGLSTAISLLISTYCIFMHLTNYSLPK
jgi:hypothetical protein